MHSLPKICLIPCFRGIQRKQKRLTSHRTRPARYPDCGEKCVYLLERSDHCDVSFSCNESQVTMRSVHEAIL
jgi:hypothetical protein